MPASACAPKLQRTAASAFRRCLKRGSQLEGCAARVDRNNNLLAIGRRTCATRLFVATPHVSPTLRYLSSSWRFKKSRGKGKPMGPTPDRLPRLLTDEGMVEHFRKAENEHAPLIALDVSPSNYGVAISDTRKTQAYPLAVIQRFNHATSQSENAKSPSYLEIQQARVFKVDDDDRNALRIVGGATTRQAHHRRQPETAVIHDLGIGFVTNLTCDSDDVFAKLRHIIEENQACGIVVGWPVSKNGIAEHTCVKVLKSLSAMRLKGKIALPVTLCDERYTTVIATRRLKHVNRIEGDDAVEELVNQTAAMIILRRFLKRSGLLKGAQRRGKRRGDEVNDAGEEDRDPSETSL